MRGLAQSAAHAEVPRLLAIFIFNSFRWNVALTCAMAGPIGAALAVLATAGVLNFNPWFGHLAHVAVRNAADSLGAVAVEATSRWSISGQKSRMADPWIGLP